MKHIIISAEVKQTLLKAHRAGDLSRLSEEMNEVQRRVTHSRLLSYSGSYSVSAFDYRSSLHCWNVSGDSAHFSPQQEVDTVVPLTSVFLYRTM